MRQSESHPTNPKSGLVKFTVLGFEAAIVTAIVSLFAFSGKAHAATPPTQVMPAPSAQQVSRNFRIPATRLSLDSMKESAAGNQICYSGALADCTFSLSHTQRLQRFSATIPVTDWIASPANLPLI